MINNLNFVLTILLEKTPKVSLSSVMKSPTRMAKESHQEFSKNPRFQSIRPQNDSNSAPSLTHTVQALFDHWVRKVVITQI